MKNQTRLLSLGLATILLTFALAACNSGSAEACTPIQLTAPDGSAIDLTGTWEGNDSGLYYIRQVDSCVWWSGVSNFVAQGQYPGQEWIMAFKGHVTAEGVITGDFVDVKSTNPGTGTLTIEIRQEDVDGQKVINLYRTGHTGHEIGVTFWGRYVEPPPEQPVETPGEPPVVTPEAVPTQAPVETTAPASPAAS